MSAPRLMQTCVAQEVEPFAAPFNDLEALAALFSNETQRIDVHLASLSAVRACLPQGSGPAWAK